MRTTFGLCCFLAVSTAFAEVPSSGLRPGDEVSAWEPVHVAGPHAGTKTCPVCTYLDAPVVLAFVKDMQSAAALAKPLEAIAVAHRLGKLKVVLVVVAGSDEELRKLASDADLHAVMLCRPDAAQKAKQLAAYKVDAAGPSSVLLYQEYAVKKAWAGVTAADLIDVKSAADQYLPKR